MQAKSISSGLLGAAGLIGSTVVQMTWPSLDLVAGLSILAGCALAMVVAVAIWIPDAVRFVRRFKKTSDKERSPPDGSGDPTLLKRGDVVEADLKIGELVQTALRTDVYEDVSIFLRAVRQQAIYGRITVWGRRNSEPEWCDLFPLVEIDRQYWEDHKINEYQLVIEKMAETIHDDGTEQGWFSDLHVSKIEACKIWPEVSI